MLGNEGMIQRGRGLVDLIAGKTPTFHDWTTYPTDAANMTDGDISTVCTTGDKDTVGPWGYAYFEWDLGAFYNVLLSCVGGSSATVGTPSIYLLLWDGAAWIKSRYDINNSSTRRLCEPYGGMGSKVRLGITADAAATITPNIRELHAWRL